MKLIAIIQIICLGDFFEKCADTVISATPLHCPVEWIFKLNDKNLISINRLSEKNEIIFNNIINYLNNHEYENYLFSYISKYRYDLDLVNTQIEYNKNALEHLEKIDYDLGELAVHAKKRGGLVVLHWTGMVETRSILKESAPKTFKYFNEKFEDIISRNLPKL